MFTGAGALRIVKSWAGLIDVMPNATPRTGYAGYALRADRRSANDPIRFLPPCGWNGLRAAPSLAPTRSSDVVQSETEKGPPMMTAPIAVHHAAAVSPSKGLPAGTMTIRSV